MTSYYLIRQEGSLFKVHPQKDTSKKYSSSRDFLSMYEGT